MPTGGTKRKAPRGDRLSWVQVFMVFLFMTGQPMGLSMAGLGIIPHKKGLRSFPRGLMNLYWRVRRFKWWQCSGY